MRSVFRRRDPVAPRDLQFLPGYAKQEIATSSIGSNMDIALTPFKVKVLYLSSYGAARKNPQTVFGLAAI
jgi:hypothetical protein